MSANPPPDETAVVVRPMQPEDIPQVQAIDQISFTMPWPASAYNYELYENPGSLLWVAEKLSADGAREVVGLLVMWLIIDEAHIATIAVHPEHRGQGIAAELLAEALATAANRGMATATLEVRAYNPPAHRLYRRFGFVEVGRRPRYYRDNQEDALIMTLEPLDAGYLAWLGDDGWKSHSEKPHEP